MTTVEVIVTCVKVLAVFTAVQMTVPVWAILERRGMAPLQDRVGPDRCGPWGLLQPFADAVKLAFKEDITPRAVDKLLYFTAPAIVLILPALVFAVIPFGSHVEIGGLSISFQVADFHVGVLYVLAVLSMGAFGIAFGGWASNNKYSSLSALRGVAQSISYEIAMGLAVIAVIMSAESTQISAIVAEQAGNYLGFIPRWHIFTQPLAAVIFLVAMYAETNRTPFDFVECEQELVAGYMTEFGSMKFSALFQGEYMSMSVMCGLFTTLFLGGWTFPWVDLGALGPGNIIGGILSILVFGVKWFFMAWLFVWVRWTVPRLRYDKLMMLGWKGLIPLALINILATGFIGIWFKSWLA
jgi:NADH-quinone oxidoreductase subunit H